jgi:sigma-B regulation protein RsbU (phosphoserine phosphatase)
VLLERAADHLARALAAGAVVIFTRVRDHALWAVASVGSREDLAGRLKLETDAMRIDALHGATRIAAAGLTPRDEAVLTASGATLVAPVRVKGDTTALLALGEPPARAPYGQAEIEFIESTLETVGRGLEALRLRGQTREYEEAKEIQEGLLPKEIPQIPGHHVFGEWQPASAVGGDYFDALRVGHARLALCVADVVGKGMPAALLMSNHQAAVKAFASEALQPRDLATKVNRVLSSNIAANKFITFFYCLHDGERRLLRYTNAGHNPPILLRADGSHLRLHEGGAVLGIFSNWSYEQAEVAVAPGDRLVLFTDGVTEVCNSEGEEFGEERLIEFVTDHRELEARQLVGRVMQAVSAYSGGEFQDDATLIVMSCD